MGRRVPRAPFAAASATHRQALLAVEPEQLLMVHLHPLSRQQDAKAAIAEPAALIRQLTQPPSKRLVAGILLAILERRSIQCRQSTSPTLAHTMPVHYVTRSATLRIGRQ